MLWFLACPIMLVSAISSSSTGCQAIKEQDSDDAEFMQKHLNVESLLGSRESMEKVHSSKFGARMEADVMQKDSSCYASVTHGLPANMTLSLEQLRRGAVNSHGAFRFRSLLKKLQSDSSDARLRILVFGGSCDRIDAQKSWISGEEMSAAQKWVALVADWLGGISKKKLTPEVEFFSMAEAAIQLSSPWDFTLDASWKKALESASEYDLVLVQGSVNYILKAYPGFSSDPMFSFSKAVVPRRRLDEIIARALLDHANPPALMYVNWFVSKTRFQQDFKEVFQNGFFPDLHKYTNTATQEHVYSSFEDKSYRFLTSYYEISMVSARSALLHSIELESASDQPIGPRFSTTDVFDDALHPNIFGHALLSQVVKFGLCEQLRLLHDNAFTSLVNGVGLPTTRLSSLPASQPGSLPQGVFPGLPAADTPKTLPPEVFADTANQLSLHRAAELSGFSLLDSTAHDIQLVRKPDGDQLFGSHQSKTQTTGMRSSQLGSRVGAQLRQQDAAAVKFDGSSCYNSVTSGVPANATLSPEQLQRGAVNVDGAFRFGSLLHKLQSESSDATLRILVLGGSCDDMKNDYHNDFLRTRLSTSQKWAHFVGEWLSSISKKKLKPEIDFFSMSNQALFLTSPAEMTLDQIWKTALASASEYDLVLVQGSVNFLLHPNSGYSPNPMYSFSKGIAARRHLDELVARALLEHSDALPLMYVNWFATKNLFRQDLDRVFKDKAHPDFHEYASTATQEHEFATWEDSSYAFLSSYYEISMVSARSALLHSTELESASDHPIGPRFSPTEIFDDGLHPNANGHLLLSQIVNFGLCEQFRLLDEKLSRTSPILQTSLPTNPPTIEDNKLPPAVFANPAQQWALQFAAEVSGFSDYDAIGM